MEAPKKRARWCGKNTEGKVGKGEHGKGKRVKEVKCQEMRHVCSRIAWKEGEDSANEKRESGSTELTEIYTCCQYKYHNSPANLADRKGGHLCAR